MERGRLVWIVGAIALVLALGATAAAITLAGDEEDTLSLHLVAGASHAVTATAPGTVHNVEADFEVTNDGDAPAALTLTLAAPDGTTLASREITVAPGDSAEIEVSRAFPDGGPAGIYTATLRVGTGRVHATEGGVDLDESEEEEDED